jgi:hypothetical protein
MKVAMIGLASHGAEMLRGITSEFRIPAQQVEISGPSAHSDQDIAHTKGAMNSPT